MARPLLDGLRAWTLQRTSALYLLVFGIVLAVRMLAAPPGNHAAWVGARDVILDYVRPAGARPIALGLVAAVLLFTGFRLARALLAVAT